MNFEKDPQLNPYFVCAYIDDQWARRHTFVMKNKIELQPIFQRSLLQTNHIFCSSMIVLNFWPWSHPFIKHLQFASVQFPRFQTILTFFLFYFQPELRHQLVLVELGRSLGQDRFVVAVRGSLPLDHRRSGRSDRPRFRILKIRDLFLWTLIVGNVFRLPIRQNKFFGTIEFLSWSWI
jgi:hypothetical protein